MPSILCIESDVNFLELEKNSLEAEGYTVVIASDGANIRRALPDSISGKPQEVCSGSGSARSARNPAWLT